MAHTYRKIPDAGNGVEWEKKYKEKFQRGHLCVPKPQFDKTGMKLHSESWTPEMKKFHKRLCHRAERRSEKQMLEYSLFAENYKF